MQRKKQKTRRVSYYEKCNMELLRFQQALHRTHHSAQLCSPLWIFHVENGDQILLKNVVYRLRKKIEADPSHPMLLQTWQGGYAFQG